jgi:hypothetical protein
MSRSREEIAAELAVLELEDELAAAKEYGGAEMEMKLRLREARRHFRSFREGRPPTDGEARPPTIATGSEVL